MRALYFTAAESGLTRGQLRWGEQQGRWRRVERSTYRHGDGPVTALDRAIGLVVSTGAPASGTVAGVLHGLDAVRLGTPEVSRTLDASAARPGVRRRAVDPSRVTSIAGIPCTDALQTLLDLALALSDDEWEQALESALRHGAVALGDLEAAVGRHPGRSAPRGAVRARRVLAKRPEGCAPTGSLLETLAVQLCRDRVPDLGDPVRQHEVRNTHGEFVAFVDLCWPQLGIFLELDGQQHEGQPVYDASRQTNVVAATGWLVVRLTWDEVHRHPVATARRLALVAGTARQRRAS
jgi:very-short-patch-repair endonuclease